jgi:hypothetical protein
MILHILKKDVRRLWPHAIATLVLLAAMARQDRWRSDWLVGSTEGWLNLLLPLAWAFLIGLVMEQEPLVGDRQFWTTRPYQRHVLFSAKALFAVTFIHVPYLLASCYVVLLRGFSPILYFPHLLWQQLLLAGALTLPAMALAALVRNFTHFILETVAVAATAIFVSGSLSNYYRTPGALLGDVRSQLIIVLVAGVSIAVLWMQYSRRRLLISRVVGISGAVLACAIFGYLMPQTAFALRSTLDPAPSQITLQISHHGKTPWRGWTMDPLTVRSLLVPVAFSGVPEELGYHAYTLWTEVIGSSGERFRTTARQRYAPSRSIALSGMFWRSFPEDQAAIWLLLHFGRTVYERLSNTPVTVRGEIAVTVYRLGGTTWMPTGIRQSVPGVGLCESVVAEGGYVGQRQLKVECESPGDLPSVTRIRLWHPGSGEDWKSQVGFGSFISISSMAWLSPIDRRQTVFTLTGAPRQGPGSEWLVPAEYISTAKISITPEEIVGYRLVRYEFSNLSLRDYLGTPTPP